MKLLIAADMEGISGVVHGDQTNASHAEYARFRRIMTRDVNAAIRGAFDGGATEVIVADGHGGGRNILIEELDARARLNSGSPAPFAMVQGLDPSVKGVIFIGYHARVGTPRAVLDHTYSSGRIDNLWLNGQLMGEIGLNSAVCGHFGVPVLMISGDQSACKEAVTLLGALETVEVKQATGRTAALCLPPEVAQEKIRMGAERAVKGLQAGNAPQPFQLTRPITVAVEFIRSEMADSASRLPGAKRLEGKQIEITVADMLEAHNAFRALVGLAAV